MKTIAERSSGCLPLKRCGEIAAQAGLQVVGRASLAPLYQEMERLRQWQSAGYAGELGYMLRPPELLADPSQVYREWIGQHPEQSTWTLLSVFCRYDSRPPGPRPAGYGRVARYAWGRDYHRKLRRALGQFVELLGVELGKELTARISTDAIPLLERPLAAGSGLGFIGKNTLLIRPGVGSLGFLGEVLLPLAIDEEGTKAQGGCGSCTQCQSACPTGAFPQPYQLDARRCISYLTIEKSGVLTPWERAALGEWIFGCDICQEVCPFNHRSLKQHHQPDLPEFGREHGCGPYLSISELLQIMHDSEFEKRFAGTPLMRPGRANLVRNGACVAVNTTAVHLLPQLAAALERESDETARATLLWSIVALHEQEGASARADAFLDRYRRDESEVVRAEVLRLRPP